MNSHRPSQGRLRQFVTTALCLFALASLAAMAPAATLSGAFTSVSDTDFDLTAIGTQDWAYWNTTSNPTTGGPKTNEKSGGTMIGTMSPVGGGDVRGSTSGTRPYYDFVYSDGTSPGSDTVNNVIGLFNTQLNTVDAGVAVSVTLPTTDTYEVSVWVAVFQAQGEFSASLPGATDFVDTSFSGAAPPGAKESGLFTLTATPDNANDVLDIEFTLAQGSDVNANVLISGVAASVVPEPSTLALAALGLLGLLASGRRRRR